MADINPGEKTNQKKKRETDRKKGRKEKLGKLRV